MAIYKNMDIHKSSAEWMKIATKKGDKPKGLRKVYFTCHPDDMEKYFEKVCEDIFKITDCDICFTPDMTFSIPEKYYETDILSCNIIVIPVTEKLLSTPNRAMDEDFVIAKKAGVRILPLMMEPIDNKVFETVCEGMGLVQKSYIVEKYEEKFGDLQSLEPFGNDPTAKPYEEKLSEYIKERLLDDETIKRIRAAFDATIFLSYRKKDRNYANELMRLIHKNPKYQDIAIWYDEYLTPGEDFNVFIQEALDNSQLFALLVTPSLLEKNNYIYQHEYPMANEPDEPTRRKPILPTEMVKTDRKELEEMYKDIPQCIDGHDENKLDDSLFEMFKDIVFAENDDDPEHNYLIGLAYFEGISVEKNTECGIQLIEKAAEMGYIEAWEKLYNIYMGRGEYTKALVWIEKKYDYYKNLKAINPVLRIILMMSTEEKLVETYFKEYKESNLECNLEKALELVKKLYIEFDSNSYIVKEYCFLKKGKTMQLSFLFEFLLSI